MLKKITKENKGFTIIEVLIVLAIAGLILLIVFLAVPALQRNSRNTQRRNDVSKALAGAVEWSNNNNGATPAGLADVGGVLTNSDLGIYKDQVGFDVDGNTTVAWPADGNSMVLVWNVKCATESTVSAQNRSIAAAYRVETGNGTVQQCENS